MNFKKKCIVLEKLIHLSRRCSHARVTNCRPRRMPGLPPAMAEDGVSEPRAALRPWLTARSRRGPTASPRDLLPALQPTHPTRSSSRLRCHCETFPGKSPRRGGRWVPHPGPATPPLPAPFAAVTATADPFFSAGLGFFFLKTHRIQYELLV